MNSLESIQQQIRRLCQTDSQIHLTVKMSRPKLIVNNVPAIIKGVYRNLFCVEESTCGYPRTHSIQYTEVLIGQVVIAELECDAPNTPSND